MGKKKKTVLLILALLVLLGLIWGAGRPGRAAYSLPVLMYHHVVPDGQDCNEMTVTAGRLEEDLQWLENQGYTPVLPRELAAGEALPEKPVLITFDDGYRSNYDLAYPIFQKHQTKVAISLMLYMQDHCADDFLTWAMCREMDASGLIEFGSHTYLLHNLDGRGGRFSQEGPNGIQRDPEESDEAFQTRVLDDIQRSYDLLEENLGHAPVLFAYPYGLGEPDAEELIDRLFPVTLLTDAGTADLSRGLRNLPRYTVTMDEPLSYWLDPPLTVQLKRSVKQLLKQFQGLF